MGFYCCRFLLMTVLHSSSILIGSWLASILYGLVLIQLFRYFRMYPNDAPLRKGIVASSMLFCTAALVADYANVYLVSLDLFNYSCVVEMFSQPTVSFWGA